MARIEKPKVYCSAHSSRTGLPCKRPPMNGLRVCYHHGGATKASREAASRRIMAAADPAAAVLVQMMYDKTAPHAVRVTAAKDLLDRAGLTARQTVDVTLQPWQGLVDTIVSDDVVDAVVVEDGDRPALPAPTPTEDAVAGDAPDPEESPANVVDFIRPRVRPWREDE